MKRQVYISFGLIQPGSNITIEFIAVAYEKKGVLRIVETIETGVRWLCE